MLKRNPFRMKSAWVFFCSISMGPPSAAWMLWAYLLTRFASFPIAASMALCTWIKALSHYPKPRLGCCLFQKLSAFLFAFFLNLVASCCLLGPQAAQLKQTTRTLGTHSFGAVPSARSPAIRVRCARRFAPL